MRRKHYTQAGKMHIGLSPGFIIAILVGIIMIAGLCGPGQAEGAITWVDNYPAIGSPSIALNTNTSASVTGGFTPTAGSNRIIIIAIHGYPNNANGYTITIDYGGQTNVGTKIIDSETTASGNRRYAGIWYLDEADIAAADSAGNHTLTINNSNPGTNGWLAYVGTLGGVAQAPATVVNATYDQYANASSYQPGTALSVGSSGGIGIVSMTHSQSNAAESTTEGYTWRGPQDTGGASAYDGYLMGIAGSGSTQPAFSVTSGWGAFAIATLNAAAGGTPPSEVGGSLATSPEYNNGGTYYIPNPVTITEDFTSTPAVNACQYTLNNGGAWTAGTVSGSGPYTCTASNINPGSGSLTIGMRASNDGGSTWSTLSATLSRTVDATGPTDGAMSATAVSSSQIDLSWTAASDSGSGLASTNTYKVVRATGATAPADCTGTAVYTGTGLSVSDTSGLSPSTQYSYRVCAYDNLSNVSAGATASATTQAPAPCVYNPPTVSITPATPTPRNVAQGTSGYYTLTVTNNDTGSCSPSTFNLSWTNTPGMPNSDFSTTGQAATIGPISVGASSPTLAFTHDAAGGATIGATQQTSVSVSDANHTTPVASNTVTSSATAPVVPVPAGNWPLFVVVAAGIIVYGMIWRRRRGQPASRVE